MTRFEDRLKSVNVHADFLFWLKLDRPTEGFLGVNLALFEGVRLVFQCMDSLRSRSIFEKSKKFLGSRVGPDLSFLALQY